MRILLTNHFPLEGSGSGVYTKALAHGLIKKGHEVRIIVPENEPVQYHDLDVRPVYFNDICESALPFNFPCFTTHPRSLQTFYDLSDAEYHSYCDTFEQTLQGEIETFHPDLIHAGHIWTIPALAAKYDLPLVITAHGTELNNYHRDARYQKDAVNAFLAADQIIAISEDNAILMHEIFKSKKGIVLHNGYNPDVFYRNELKREEVLKSFGIKGNFEKIVAFVGKFAEFKGIDTLVKAAALYENEKTLTLLAGDGLLRAEMEDLKASLGIKNLVFLGNRKPDEVCRLFNIADLSVVPSRKEPFGLVVIEAMACGCPVVGSNTGGIPEIIKPHTGRIFEQDHHEELAAIVTEILKENDFDRKAIADYAKAQYSNDFYVEKILQLYQQAIVRHNRGI